DTIVLVGFGGGLTWGAMTTKWTSYCDNRRSRILYLSKFIL
ncbi:hypothetical protein ACF7OR_02370, partial [Staphylococcus aureus]